jgi:hypothetical protein
MSEIDDTRVPAKVRVATCEVDEDRGWILGWVHVTGPTDGWGQGFGGLVLDEASAKDWTESICALFGVQTLAECTGRFCHVLRSWPTYGSDIEGLEVDGKRFTLTAFRRKHWPAKAKSVLENRKADLLRSIARAGEDVQRFVHRLETVEHGYVDWEVLQTSEAEETER